MGSGKSETLKLLAKQNFPVAKADDISRSLLLKAPRAKELRAWVSARDGLKGRDRRAALLSDPQKLQKAENILHPLARERFEAFAAEKTAEGERLVFYEIPPIQSLVAPACDNKKTDDFAERTKGALFGGRFDSVILIVRPQEAARQSLLQKGFREKDIQARLKRQAPLSFLEKRADFVLRNTGDLSALSKKLNAVLQTGFGVESEK